jgi:hypothetical protein
VRRVTFDRSVVGKLTANLSAANDAAIVGNTSAGGITIDRKARRVPKGRNLQERPEIVQ